MERYYAYILFFVFFSCSNPNGDDPIFDNSVFPQRWELTGMSTGLSGGFLEGEELPWTETIFLESNGKFVKTRVLDDQQKKGTGVFSFKEVNDERHLVLTYATETDLIMNCSSENMIETLYMSGVNSLTGGAAPCDGLGLFYERKE